ncbi:MAG: PIN domain-containing protein [Dehalococcoidia bacterium]|nr:PIN domain-containing protein [Dehalococcoidia bacterium]
MQILQEFYHQATRPMRTGRLTHGDAIAFLGALLKFPIQDVTLELFREATAVSQRFGLSYWDAAILAAARSLGCDAVYSEDLSPGQDYGGVRVINPFLEEPAVP